MSGCLFLFVLHINCPGCSAKSGQSGTPVRFPESGGCGWEREAQFHVSFLVKVCFMLNRPVRDVDTPLASGGSNDPLKPGEE